MKRLRIHWSIAIVLLIIISCSKPKAPEKEVYVLFEENENDWFIEGDAQWKFDKHELIGSSSKGSGFVMTKMAFEDFVLKLEFNPDSTINSGVFVRCTINFISATECFEINIWDLHPNQDSRTGAIVKRSNPLAQVETINKWNTYEIKCQKNHIMAWVNGVLTADIREERLVVGYVALQAMGTGQIRFRNIELRPLKSSVAP